MRSLLLAAALATSASLAPEPVRADCLNENIQSCNADFPSSSEQVIGARGWCYVIRIAWCKLFD
jgi:hypothetical protein